MISAKFTSPEKKIKKTPYLMSSSPRKKPEIFSLTVSKTNPTF